MATARDRNSRELAILARKELRVDLNAPIPLKIVLWGPYGCGKTTFASKLSRQRAILFTAEHGAHSLRNNEALLKRVEVLHYTSLDLALWEMRLIDEVAEGYEKFSGVILDTATSITSLIRESISRKKSGEFPMETETVFNGFASDVASTALEFKEHGAVEAVWREFATRVRREFLKCDLIITAQEKIPSEIEAKSGMLVGPKMPEGPREQILTDADFAVRLFQRNGKRMVLTERSGIYDAKNRAGLPKEMEEKDFIMAVREWSKGRIQSNGTSTSSETPASTNQ